MSYVQQYTFLDDAWHPIALEEHTECGLPIPHGNGWVRDVPDGDTIHCGENATKPKAKAKKD